jgi:hypothetical protein
VRTAAMESSCPLIKNILILDSEGKRIAVKYYGTDWYPPCPSLSPPISTWCVWFVGVWIDAGAATHDAWILTVSSCPFVRALRNHPSCWKA